ncbi:dipeptidyl peptidase [Schizosaccharomyces japonicus yFS275]|uniref:Dipeptidyl peptidase n=1 Tax=Schizosaccharomyces japonicus (strain yFS275 / FY16936) TaxID=402676 RepID=B6K0K9_SCHJY|nr:dipeptidyl peptidase [Schizosaccharomyces japonicus yFS275]EEB07480.1 dipeptidyl peptidase [Schizosaccharomyces japonicus yFS275]
MQAEDSSGAQLQQKSPQAKQHWRRRSALVSLRDLSPTGEAYTNENDDTFHEVEIQYPTESSWRERGRFRFWRKRLLFAVIVCFLMLFIIFAIIKTKGFGKYPLFKKRKPLFPESGFFNDSLLPFHISVSWLLLPNGESVFYDKHSPTAKLVFPNGTVLFEAPTLTSFVQNEDSVDEFFEISFSSDARYVLYKFEKRRRWRYSSYMYFFLLDVERQEFTPFHTEFGDVFLNALWSPVGHRLAFVADRNVYIWHDVGKAIENVTKDTPESNIFNGVPDWMYEEDIVQRDHTLWWSPDASKLAFLQINDSLVPSYAPPSFSGLSSIVGENDLSKYADALYAYPVPGSTIPDAVVVVHHVSEHTSSAQKAVSYGFLRKERYITEVAWTDSDHLVYSELNRDSSQRVTMLLDFVAVEEKVVQKEVKFRHGWLEPQTGLAYLPPDSRLGRSEGYVRLVAYEFGYSLVFYDFSTQKSTVLVEAQGFSILEPLVASSDGLNLFFTILEEGGTTKLMRYSFIDSALHSLLPSKRAGAYTFHLSPCTNYVHVAYDGPGVPWQRIYETLTMHQTLSLEENEQLLEITSKYAFPEKRVYRPNFKYESVNVEEILPPNFNKRKKYRTLFHIYGAPGVPIVTHGFEMDINEYLAAYLNIIVVKVDFLGELATSGGIKHLSRTSPFELIQSWIDVLDKISSKSYIDRSNISIWGWSFGGYLSLKLAETGNLFKSVFVVSPVTDWSRYSSFYTEKYLGLYNDDNRKSYEQAAIHVDSSIRSLKNLYVVQGLSDDNVHVEQTALLANSLMEHEQYSHNVMYLNQEAHEFTGEGMKHLRGIMVNFLSS